MAYTFSVNNTPANGNQAAYLVLLGFIAGGWTVVASSDGTTYNPSGNQITGSGTGAGGLGNPLAWFRVQAPAVAGQTREWLVQRSADGPSINYNWRVKYSAAAGFAGGSPSATQTPASADAVYAMGGGTDASPTFAQLWDSDGSYRVHMGFGGTPEQYSFFVFAFNVGGTTTKLGWAMDVVQAASVIPGDPDPAVITLQVFTSVILGVSGGYGAWFGPTGTPSNFVAINASALFGVPGGCVTNNISGKVDLINVPWIRAASPGGVKGWSTMFLWCATAGPTNGDTINTVGAKDRVMVNGNALPWAGVDLTV